MNPEGDPIEEGADGGWPAIRPDEATGTGSRDDDCDDRAGRGRRGVVALDNSGTISDVAVEAVVFVDDADFDAPVHVIRVERPTALVNVALEDAALLDTDAPAGTVLEEAGVSLHLALSNVETAEPEARRATFADGVAPARPLFAAAERLRWALADEQGHETPPVGVQLVVELDPGRIHRGYAYASVPRAGSRSAVEAAHERGFDVHIVSGDATHVLESVAARIGVPAGNVHPYQSPAGKAETVAALRERSDGPVVMVGDYVNDRLAFERADRAVLVCADGDPDPALASRVDAVAGSLSEVVTRL